MNKNIDVIIVASGRGTRAQNGTTNLAKQYQTIAHKAVLTHSMQTFAAHPHIRSIQVVIHPDDLPHYENASLKSSKILPPVFGGETRQCSVYNGLKALSKYNPDYVLIHDGARPNLDAQLINRGLTSLANNPNWAAAIPTTPITQSTASCDENGNLSAHINREHLKLLQTPQMCNFNILLKAIENKMKNNEFNFPDESSILLECGHHVGTFAGCPTNIKITTPEDFHILDKLMTPQTQTRTGYGYDMHATQSGDHVWLCGIKIPAQFSLNGHSDADVALHALTDALLGSIGAGDIGLHFKNTDPKWKGAASEQFVAFALNELAKKHAQLLHIDINIIAQEPKIMPHREQMIAKLSNITSLPASAIGLKATTAEGIGAIGRCEGISATALASISLPIEA